VPPSTLTEPDQLDAAKSEQLKRDLDRLLPDGPLDAAAPGVPIKDERAAKLPGKVEGEYASAVLTMPELQAPTALTKLFGRARWQTYPMGGWVYHGVTARMQREDQGQDFEVPLGHHLIAPGWGKCVHHLGDLNFPSGFGNPYAVVYIGSGRFGGALWYLGHDNGSPLIPVGWTFHTGRILATPNHWLNAGWGWSEVGHAPGGYPGPFGEGARHHAKFAPVRRWTSE
jgi:hypothetical protein